MTTDQDRVRDIVRSDPRNAYQNVSDYFADRDSHFNQSTILWWIQRARNEIELARIEENRREQDAETPFGIALDGMSDEVEL